MTWLKSRDPFHFRHTIEHIFKPIWAIETSNLVCVFVLSKAERAQKYPQKGRSLGHVTPKFFGIQSEISKNCFSQRLPIWYISLSWESREGAQIIFSQRSVAWLRSRDTKIFDILSNIYWKLLELKTPISQLANKTANIQYINLSVYNIV